MLTVGQKLREERIRQGKEIKPIADELRISSRYIQAIEAENWDQFPSGFFGRSFIRQYAIVLGLDPTEYENAIPSEAPVEEPVQTQALVHQKRSWDIAVPPLVAPRGKGIFDLKMWAALAGLVLAIVAGSNLYSWYEEGHNGKPMQKSAQASKAEVVQSDAPSPESTLSKADGLLSLSVAATEATWLEISSNGQRLFSGLLEVGQTQKFDKTESARMVVGNAGGVVIRRSGRDIGPIGERGQVRVVLFSQDTWQILQSAVPQAPKVEETSTTVGE